MKISVACCVYNGARFLDQQLRSVVDQTVRPDEIVIVDDVSSDDSVAVAERFASDAPAGVTVRVERNVRNQGVAANFEKALAMTTGDLVFLCDQDDLWHPTKVETMARAFEERGDLLLLHGDARLIDAAGGSMAHTLFEALELRPRERQQVKSGAAFSALLVRNLVTGATAALRRTAFEKARPFPPEWVHDEWLAIIAATFGRVDFLDGPLINYRQHGGNQIGMRKLSWPDKFNRLWVPRGNHFAKLERRIDVLRERLIAMGPVVPPRCIAEVVGKQAHAHVRATLPAARLRRLLPIAREVATGRYGRYSSGFQGIVRDCLEPL